MIDYQKISEEYIKCYSDKSRIYMIKNYLKTFDGTQGREAPFDLFPRQQILCKTLGEGKNSVATTKYRQAGISSVAAAFISCETALADSDSPKNTLIIGNTLEIAQQMFYKIKMFLMQFPLWMWGNPQEYINMGFDITQPPDRENLIFEKCNQKEMILKNGCRIHARSSDTEASRGLTIHYLCFDEVAFIENAKEVYTAALPTISSTKGSKCLFISTPHGKDQLYYPTVQKAKLKGTKDWNGFDLVEMFWFQDPRYNRYLRWTKKNPENGEIDIINETVIDDKGNIPYDEERWEKLKKEGWKPISPWYESMCRQFNNDPQRIAQELDASFLGSDSTVVSPEFIEMQLSLNVREPNPELKDNVLDDLWIWKEPIEGHRYIMACLPTGEKVLTDSGLKNIENVTLNDRLVNKDGNYVKINTIKSRYVDNELIVEYKLKNIFDSVKFTWNHPIWSSMNTKIIRPNRRKHIFNFKFNRANDINAGDWIEIPNVYRKKELTNNEILQKWDKYSTLTRVDFKVDNPLLDEEFWWYCGMWLAEGWCYTNKLGHTLISTAHNKNEIPIHNRIKKLVKRLFSRTATQVDNKDNNGTQLFFNSKQVSSFLTNTFGKYAKNKHIEEWVKFLPVKYKTQLIRGYLEGDGCISNNQIQIVSVSKKLLMDVQDILFSVGVISGHFLSSKEKYIIINNRGKLSHCLEKYILNCGKYDTKKVLDLCGIENNIEYKFSRYPISNCYFSEDLNYIYIQIKEKKTYNYTGIVYNFDCETHTYCGNKIATHNCDNSRGSSDDATALEIIDMDGVDEDGTPCVEQVGEYNGKLTGDAVGEIAYQYGMMYNQAIIVVEDIGGYGSATLLWLMNMGYPNLYYDDPSLKRYTSQEDATKMQVTDKGLPGFHSSSVRFQMLSNFANLVKTNQFKIRSKRVINELDTWIFKNGRIDHKDGCHDDTLTCLAMGLFVIMFSINKQIEMKNKDEVMLKAMINANNRMIKVPVNRTQINTPNDNQSIINRMLYKPNNKQYNQYMWLLK